MVTGSLALQRLPRDAVALVAAEHEYRIIQGIKPGDWKWSVETESGTSDRKDAAVIAAKRAIDNALDPKKRKLSPPA